ncbi:hypothetical protein D3C77_364180 [compost metagenome]
MQALLASEQFIDIGRLMFAQGFGHQAEATGQLVHFQGLDHGQGYIKVALADLVGSFCQRLDGVAKAPGDAVGGHKSKDQHGQAHQAEQAGNQQGAVMGLLLALIDVLQGMLMGVDQISAQGIESLAQRMVGAEAARRCAAGAKGLEVLLVMLIGLGKPFIGRLICLMAGALVEQLLELRLQVLQRLGIGGVIKHQRQLFTEVLPQLQAKVEGNGVLADRCLLCAGHLQHADQAQQ